MPAGTPVKRPLTQLNHEIDETEVEVARLAAERAAVAKDVTRAVRRLRYLLFARSFRRPKATFELWPTAVLLIGSALVGVFVFVVVHWLFGMFPLTLLGLVIGLSAGVVAISALLHRPPDALLPAAIEDAQSQLRLANARLNEKLERLAETNDRLKKLLDERRDQIASGKLQRAALLQRNWKSMRGAEWEDFVVEVLRTHGATVERVGRIGDEDANLIVDLGTRRFAVFTEGEGQPVTSATIQQALAARERLRCDRCAVIINRRFTGAAQDFAQRNSCLAIGVSEFPDFVLGKIEL